MKYITTLLLLITIQIFGGIGIGESANTPLPVELSSFTASIEENRVIFQWTTANEINNHGFEIERTVEAIDRNPKSEYIVLGFVSGSGNSNSPKVYSFRDESIVPGRFNYRLKQLDTDGKFRYIKTIEIEFGLPNQYELYQNYPNPFNPTTTISYSLPQESHVTVKVFNVVGNEVAKVVNERQNAGKHILSFNGANLTSGIYFYRIEAYSTREGISYTDTKKMSIIK